MRTCSHNLGLQCCNACRIYPQQDVSMKRATALDLIPNNMLQNFAIYCRAAKDVRFEE
jgi:hypothetical protein